MSDKFLNDNHNHSFNVGILKVVNCYAAALIHFNLTYWITHNFKQKSKKHFHKDKYWVYFSQQELANTFEYMNRDEVQRALKKLIQKELLLVDNFNIRKGDRTKWYTLSPKAIGLLGLGYPQPLCENAQSTNTGLTADQTTSNPDEHSLCENAQALCENAQALPDTLPTDTINSNSISNDQDYLLKLFRSEIGDKTFYRGHAKLIIKLHLRHQGMTLRESLASSVAFLKKHMSTNHVDSPGALFIYEIKKSKFFGDTSGYTTDAQDSDRPEVEKPKKPETEKEPPRPQLFQSQPEISEEQKAKNIEAGKRYMQQAMESLAKKNRSMGMAC